MLIEKSLRLLEQETGAIHTTLEGKLKFALAFPGPYRLGMSSLGYQIVYGLLNSIPGVACERVFLPEPADVREFQRSRTRLFTLESQTPISEFDVLAFSISYEMDYAHVAEILDLSGLPVFAAERDETHPLVLAGGPCATFNPEPLADLIDAFAIGDAEELVADVIHALENSGELDRDELLAKLAGVPGIYVPRFYSPCYNADGTLTEMQIRPPAPAKVMKRIVRDLNPFNSNASIQTPNTEFADMMLVEAMRGCKRQCRFCVSGYAGLPPRPRSIPTLPEGVKIGLVGSAVFDHPNAHAICEQMAREGREFSISSIRIESLTDDLARMMRSSGQRTMTIAPEAGAQSLRQIINKPTTDEEIFNAARMAEEAGFQRLKLYFMIGLPEEKEADIDAIAKMARELVAAHPSLKLQLSVSCFVPKPWTPFQWYGFGPINELSKKLSSIKRAVAGDMRIEFSSESPRSAYVQAWLARGDRRLGRVIAAAAGSSYARAASELRIDTDFYAVRHRGEHEIFPWDHIDLLVGKDYLRKEYLRTLDGQLTPDCNVGICTRCGVC